MIKKNLSLLSAVLFMGALFFTYTGAEAKGKIKVKRGSVVVDKVKYRIFKGVKKVEKGQHGGIRYEIQCKSESEAMKKGAAIAKFYKGKKMNGVKVPKLSKTAKPETEAWTAFKQGKKKGIGVIVKVSEKKVIVYILPNGDSGVEGMLL
ncbi:hypothetical protein ACFL20_11400 [Spirochaetota bacterium]